MNNLYEENQELRDIISDLQDQIIDLQIQNASLKEALDPSSTWFPLLDLEEYNHNDYYNTDPL